MDNIRIDAHQHFWIFKPEDYPWIAADNKILSQDFLPEQLLPELTKLNLNGCIAVQARQKEEENNFLLSLAVDNHFIKGVVGWVDLQDPNLEKRLDFYASFAKLKGFRHVIQDEPDKNFILRPSFLKGVALLKKYGFTYDILVFHSQLSNTLKFLDQFPEHKMVIDHLAKPDIRRKQIREWKHDIQHIAAHRNVYCKLSGMVTEADWQHWEKQDFFPYLEVVTNAFGVDRIMYGSDWPVCRLGASYEQQYHICTSFFSTFSETEKAMIFGGNARTFYNV